MIVRLNNIEIFAHHGVYHEERERGTTFHLDVEWTSDHAQLVETDDISYALDYQDVFAVVHSMSTSNQYALLETWASELAKRLIRSFAQIDRVMIRIRKPGIAVAPEVRDIEVEHEQTRDEVA